MMTEIPPLFRFIQESIFELNARYVQDKDIRIMLPEMFKDAFGRMCFDDFVVKRKQSGPVSFFMAVEVLWCNPFLLCTVYSIDNPVRDNLVFTYKLSNSEVKYLVP